MKFEKVKGTQNHHLFRPFNDKGEVRDVYWVRFYKVTKGRLEESLKTNSLSDARIARDKRIAEFLGTKPKFAGKGVLLEDVWPDFIKLKEAKSVGTQNINKYSWDGHLKEGFGHLLIEDIDENAWLMWVIGERKKNPSRKFSTEKRVLQNIINWLHAAGRIPRCPKFEDVDPERNAGKVYTLEEMGRLLETALKLDNMATAMHLQIVMGCEMMMRHGEIWSLEWTQVDMSRKLIHLPAAKTKIRKSRTFAISDNAFDGLKAIRKESGDSPWVFPSLANKERPAGRNSANNYWAKIKRRAKVKGRFHDLRHTGLTHAFKNAVNPALICEFAGLSLEEAQNTYLHFTPEDTRVVAGLFKAVE